ncbi:MAG: PQQ-binding-like beta-propeller repeat protein, partial [Pseudomonadota bacterium]
MGKSLGRSRAQRRITLGALAAVIGLSVINGQIARAEDDAGDTVSNENLINPPAESWLMFRGNHASWGYSALDQINRKNVSDTQLAWTAAMTPGSSQPTPIVHDGVLYVPNPRDQITAHNATTGDLLWSYRHKRRAEVWGSGDITRNIAIYDGKIYHAAGDARLIALDKTTGKLVWDVSVGDPALTTHSSGPIIANGRVFAGRVCRYAPPARCDVAHLARPRERPHGSCACARWSLARRGSLRRLIVRQGLRVP